jgi:ubiquinone biosynthesis monooxygenase Coq7
MSVLDPVILQIDLALRTVLARAPSVRPMPGETILESAMSDTERRHAAALMRVNHVGEVCAQALYAGQSFVTRNPVLRDVLAQAAGEETEHLNWMERRIDELGGRKSLLNPLWYVGAWSIGVVAGRFGDQKNLGFLAETERQVERHLDEHLGQLPEGDQRSRAILTQMKLDEITHAQTAIGLGAAELPLIAKRVMRVAAKVMTKVAYRV